MQDVFIAAPFFWGLPSVLHFFLRVPSLQGSLRCVVLSPARGGGVMTSRVTSRVSCYARGQQLQMEYMVCGAVCLQGTAF